jgi:hypothetical protein
MVPRTKNLCIVKTSQSLTPAHLLQAKGNAAAEKRRQKKRAQKGSANVKRRNPLQKPTAALLKSHLGRNSTLLGYARNATKLSASKTLKRNLFFARESAIVHFIMIVPTCHMCHRRKRNGYAKIARKGVINVQSATSTEPTMKTFTFAIRKVADSFFTNHA